MTSRIPLTTPRNSNILRLIRKKFPFNGGMGCPAFQSTEKVSSNMIFLDFVLHIYLFLGLNATLGLSNKNMNNAESASVSMIVNVDETEKEADLDIEAENEDTVYSPSKSEKSLL